MGVSYVPLAHGHGKRGKHPMTAQKDRKTNLFNSLCQKTIKIV